MTLCWVSFGCSRPDDESVESNGYMTLTAISQDQTTRTVLGDDGSSVIWSAGDQIGVWIASSSQATAYTLEPSSAGTTTGQFSGETVSGTPLFAYYPYDGISSAGDGTCSVNLPQQQMFVSNGFGPGSNPMAATGNGSQLSFQNLCGVIGIQVTGTDTLSSIEVISTSESLSGAFDVEITQSGPPTLTPASGAVSSVTLNGIDTPLSNTPQMFYIVVPPQTYAAGLSFTLNDTSGGTMTLHTQQPLTITRSVITELASFAYVSGVVEYRYDSNSDWVLWRGSTGLPQFVSNLALLTTEQAAVSAAQVDTIVSYINSLSSTASAVSIDMSQCSYETDVFPTAFQGMTERYTHLAGISLPQNITTISAGAFMGCSSMTHVNFPAGLVSVGAYAFSGCLVLEAVELPATLQTIGVQGFMHCSVLNSITIPASVTSIGDLAFQYCAQLGTITFESMTPPTISSSAFGTVGSTLSIAGNRVSGTKQVVVPAGATGYESAEWFSPLSSIGFTIVEQ